MTRRTDGHVLCIDSFLKHFFHIQVALDPSSPGSCILLLQELACRLGVHTRSRRALAESPIALAPPPPGEPLPLDLRDDVRLRHLLEAQHQLAELLEVHLPAAVRVSGGAPAWASLGVRSVGRGRTPLITLKG